MAILDASRLNEGGGAISASSLTPYNPLSGNTPDYVAPVDLTYLEGMNAAAAAREAAAASKFAAGWKQAAVIVTPNGEEIAVDRNGKASDGTVPIGTTKATSSGSGSGSGSGTTKKVVSTYTDPTTGDVVSVYDDGSQAVISKGTNAITAQQKAAADLAAKRAAGQSAYDLLYNEFDKYGLGSLVGAVKDLIQKGASGPEMTIALRQTPDYQKRFAGNAQRIANGLAAIDEATYLAKEDAYQNLMRNYGLPDTYWKKDQLGTQEGFTKLIANDVSALELEKRLQTAQDRVVNANPEIAYALKAFYPDITKGDILAYALDPKNALDQIQRKVTAAEIGGAALSQGLTTSLGGAEGLAAYGITKAQAQQGYQTVAGVLPRATELSNIYGEQPYTQQTAEAEVFGTTGAADAKKRREKLVSLEKASFGGSSGVGALGRDKAIYGGAQGQSGQF